jgi:hypothetical protein
LISAIERLILWDSLPRELFGSTSTMAEHASHDAECDLRFDSLETICAPNEVGYCACLLFGIDMIELKNRGIGLAAINARMMREMVRGERAISSDSATVRKEPTRIVVRFIVYVMIARAHGLTRATVRVQLVSASAAKSIDG